jgi:DNA-directed RNA polymerase subunit L
MITAEEMIAVVERYILQEKGVRVQIYMIPHPLLFQRQLDMLHYAYNVSLSNLK